VSARRLRPYFQAHAIQVLTEYHLKKVLQKPDLSGRLVNWAVELRQFDIEFHPRKQSKDRFWLIFWSRCNIPETEELPKGVTWVACVDGSSANQRSGEEVTLTGPKEEKFEYAIKLDFATTNNEAEYEDVLAGLSITREMGIANLEIRSDSQVVVGQINGGFASQRDKMTKYLEKVCQFNLILIE
jgi:hypothetical protein